MTNFVLRLVIILQFLISSSMAAGPSGIDGLAIATKSYNNSRGWKEYIVGLQMDIQLGGGNTTTKYLRLKNFEGKSGDKSLVVFEKPADVQGTALLTHAHLDAPNDQWLYLPEMRRKKRIAADSRNKSFMGSEFTYDDMTFNDLNKYTYKLLREENCSLGSCYVIEQIPKDKDSTYSKLLVWYDKQTFRIDKTTYYDLKNEVLKELMRKNYQKPNKKNWFAGEMVMNNIQTKKSTTLKFSEFKFDAKLSEKDFSPESLDR